MGQRISKQARRQQILEITARLIENNGFDGITAKQLANAAEISDTLIFRHFGKMETLFKEVCNEFIRNITAIPMDPRVNKSRDFITEFSTQFIKQNLKHPRSIRLLTWAQMQRPDYIKDIHYKIHNSGPLLELKYKMKSMLDNDHEAEMYINLMFGALLSTLRNFLVFGMQDHQPDPKKIGELITRLYYDQLNSDEESSKSASSTDSLSSIDLS